MAEGSRQYAVCRKEETGSNKWIARSKEQGARSKEQGARRRRQ